MKIQEKFVTFEQAKRLKNLGFDEPSIARYSKGGSFQMNSLTEWYKFNSNEISGGWISAPLFQDVFEWFESLGIVCSYTPFISNQDFNSWFDIWDNGQFYIEMDLELDLSIFSKRVIMVDELLDCYGNRKTNKINN